MSCFAVPANRNRALDPYAQIIAQAEEIEGVLAILEHWIGVGGTPADQARWSL